jgi:hypothetical protein
VKRLLLVLALLVLPSVAGAVCTETFYLRAAGDGSAPHTIAGGYDAADFNTVGNWDSDDSADDKIGPNDCVIVLDNDGPIRAQLSVQTSGLSGKPITIIGEVGGDPIVSGAEIMGTWTSYAANTWQKAAVTTQVYTVILDGAWTTKGSGKDTLNDHEWFWETNVLYFRDESGDPDGTGVVIQAGQRANVFNGNTSRDYITVQDITFEGSNGRTVRSGGTSDYMTYEGLTVRFSADSDGGGAIFLGPTENIVRDCVIHSIQNDGIKLDNTSGALIDGVTIYNVIGTNSDGIQGSAATNGIIRNASVDMTGTNSTKGGIIITAGSSNFIIEHSTVTGGNFGISMDGTSMTARYNRLIDNNLGTTGSGITTRGASTTIKYHYNIISGADLGFYTFGVVITGLDIQNNVFYGCTDGLHGDTAGASIAGTLKNNIIWGSATRAIVFDNNVTDAGFSSNYNIIGPEAVEFVWWFTTDKYNTLAAFTAGEGDDANSSASDPLFVSASDFHLQSGSPARTVGVDLSLKFDYSGSGLPGTPDRGAYQYGWHTVFPAFGLYRETTVGNVTQFDTRH